MSNYRAPPGQIMLLMQIHYFVYQDQLAVDNNSPASKKFYQRLLRDELIEPDPCCPPPHETRQRHLFNTTARGRAYIEKLCSIELPVLVETWT